MKSIGLLMLVLVAFGCRETADDLGGALAATTMDASRGTAVDAAPSTPTAADAATTHTSADAATTQTSCQTLCDYDGCRVLCTSPSSPGTPDEDPYD